MSSELDAVDELEAQAERLQSLLQYAPRAFVMEFAGTPKSGKSTSVEAVRHFLSRHGFRVHVLSERAAICPIPMKGHLFFNTWCACSMLAELLANVETETDIVIIDRGLFDALVWLTLQQKRGELTENEASTIESFLLLERWRALIDLAVVMSVSAEEALSREENQRITRKAGSIMNPEVLAAIDRSVGDAVAQYGDRFPGVIHYPTNGGEVRRSNIELTGRILDQLASFLNPEVLVVPRDRLEALQLQDGGCFGDEASKSVMACISSFGCFMRREDAESDLTHVQIIPCGLLTNEERGVFLFQRKETDPKYRLYGKTTIWQGCHVTKKEDADPAALLRPALMDRVSRSLFLSRVFPVKLLGYCWDPNDPGSSRHFGVIHRIDINNPHTAADLKKKEFRKQRGHGWIGQFVDDWQGLVDGIEELNIESWSQAILKAFGEQP